MRRLVTSGWLIAVSLLVLALPSVPVAAADPVFVAQSVRDEIAANGQARVIVEVRLPQSFLPEGELPSLAHILGQRSNLAFAQSQVILRLQGLRSSVTRQFETAPYLALEVDADGLRQLESATSYVSRVLEDAVHMPLLPQSVPLIEGNQAWAAGFDGTGSVVAILDTGVDKSHPFLAGKVVDEACFSSTVPLQTTTLCPNGQSSQFGAGAGLNCPLSVNGCFHGTHVAGIAAGNGAGAGVSYSGVAKGAK